MQLCQTQIFIHPLIWALCASSLLTGPVPAGADDLSDLLALETRLTAVHTLPLAPGQDLSALLESENIHTFEDYIFWLRDHARYEADGETDTWASPETTFITKKGDCEDFAFLNAAVLSHFGYPRIVLAYDEPERSHVICAYRDGLFINIINNTNLVMTNHTRLETIFDELHRNHQVTALLDFSNAPGIVNVLFTKG